jgi:DNA invertase Pin-like site-specific DNA recombinase
VKAIGYVRVSSIKQEKEGYGLEIQEEQIKQYCKLKGIELVKIYTDTLSGKNTDRKAYIQMMKDILEYNILQVDTLVIHKLDRIGRSTLDLINIVNTLSKSGVTFVCTNSNIDTSTKEGRLFFYFMSALAEYERELIIERTTLGREFAMERGVKFGRPRLKIPINDILTDLINGVPKTVISRKYRISLQTLYKNLKEQKSKSKVSYDDI